jgi:hypothetical protein
MCCEGAAAAAAVVLYILCSLCPDAQIVEQVADGVFKVAQGASAFGTENATSARIPGQATQVVRSTACATATTRLIRSSLYLVGLLGVPGATPSRSTLPSRP